jgi:hypothetical protein
MDRRLSLNHAIGSAVQGLECRARVAWVRPRRIPKNCRAVFGRSAVPDAVPAAWSRPFSKGLPDLVSKALEPWQLLLITHFSENAWGSKTRSCAPGVSCSCSVLVDEAAKQLVFADVLYPS